jgi:hypothetical protein
VNDAVSKSADAKLTWLRRLSQHVLRVYATADPRSLGLFRIALGTLLFADVLRRWPDLAAHYSNAGWLTNHFALFRPMSSHLFSVYLAFGTPEEVKFLALLHLLVNLLLLVGWHTRVMHVLAALLITSLNSRNIMLENGGYVVLNLLTVWTMFLPTGRRFSVDAFLRSWRERREGTLEALADRTSPKRASAPVVSLAVTALILQWAVIYFFNVMHKNGPPWRDGTAVYYFFQQDRMVTLLGAWLREVTPLSMIRLLTWSTLIIESSVVVLLLLPVSSHIARMVGWLLVLCLHLSIDAVVQLGPFSWAMIIMFFVLIPAETWDAIAARRRAKKPERTLLIDPKNGFELTLGRVVKRLDGLGLVSFASPEQVSEAARARAAQTLVVTDAEGKNVWTGSQALVRLSEALPIAKLLVIWIRLPGVRSLVDSLLARAFGRREKLDQALDLSSLPGTDEQAPEPSAARRALERTSFGFQQLAVLLVMIACGSQVLIENRAVPEWLKPQRRPDWMTAVVVYPRLFQGWSMFAPGPPADDGRIVVEGVTVDGRRFDPLTGQQPSYEVQPKDGFRMNQIWGDFHRRIGEPRFSVYLGGVRDFLLNHHELTGRPQDRLVAFEIWQITEMIPPPGQPKAPPQRRRLLTYGAVRSR